MWIAKPSKPLAPAALALAIVSLSPLTARAQDASARAEALYAQGQKLMAAGKISEACTSFAESQKAEPALGTLLNLAACHEKENRTASAWAEFKEAARQASAANKADFQKFANDHAAKLEPKLRYVVIESKQKDVSLKLDGNAIDSGMLDTQFPVDPGEHDLAVSAAAKRPWTQHFTLSAAGSAPFRIEVPALEDAPQEPAAGGASGAPAPAGGAVTTPPPPAGATSGGDQASSGGSSGTAQRILGFGIAGVGLLGGGITCAVLAINTSTLNNQAHDPKFADQQDTKLADAKTTQTGAIVAGVAGGVLTAVGLVVALTAPHGGSGKAGRLEVTPYAGPGGAGASASLRF